MDWVIDCSVTLALGLPDEHSPEAERFVREVGSGTRWHVPALWWYETANALAVGARRRRVHEADVFQLIDLFGRLPIVTDTDIGGAAAERFCSIARSHEISAYDAAYVELAGRLGIGLFTLDRGLARAARSAGVDVFR